MRLPDFSNGGLASAPMPIRIPIKDYKPAVVAHPVTTPVVKESALWQFAKSSKAFSNTRWGYKASAHEINEQLETARNDFPDLPKIQQNFMGAGLCSVLSIVGFSMRACLGTDAFYLSDFVTTPCVAGLIYGFVNFFPKLRNIPLRFLIISLGVTAFIRSVSLPPPNPIDFFIEMDPLFLIPMMITAIALSSFLAMETELEAVRLQHNEKRETTEPLYEAMMQINDDLSNLADIKQTLLDHPELFLDFLKYRELVLKNEIDELRNKIRTAETFTEDLQQRSFLAHHDPYSDPQREKLQVDREELRLLINAKNAERKVVAWQIKELFKSKSYEENAAIMTAGEITAVKIQEALSKQSPQALRDLNVIATATQIQALFLNKPSIITTS